MSELPLLSAIMVTTGARRRFVEQAVKYWEAQTYPNKELVIIDEADQRGRTCARAIPKQETIHYVLLDTLAGSGSSFSIGAKRNLACSVATGEMICHWDDDDYFGPDRLMSQVQPILQGEADVTGMKPALVLHLPTMRLWRMAEELHRTLFPHGIRCGTLMYKKKLSRETIWYPNVSRGEDVWFLGRLLHHGARLGAVDDPASYICVRHDSNVTPDMEYGPPGWQEEPLKQYLSPELIQWYASMQKVEGGSSPPLGKSPEVALDHSANDGKPSCEIRTHGARRV